jgi:hypothetical protein
MDNNGYKVMVITVIIGVIIGLIIGTISCHSSDHDYLEDDSAYFHPSEMALEIDRLHDEISTKNEQIEIMNTAMGYLEEGGHVTVNIVECDYENNIIKLSVTNRLPTQLEIKSIGVIENYAYSRDWYDDYSDNAKGIVPVQGNVELIWNQSKAQSLGLDEATNVLVMNQSNNKENDPIEQATLSENESYSIRVECGDGTYCYTILQGDEI